MELLRKGVKGDWVRAQRFATINDIHAAVRYDILFQEDDVLIQYPL